MSNPWAEAYSNLREENGDSFKWNPNKNVIASKNGKLGIMDKGDPKSWREPSEQEKGEIPLSSTSAFEKSSAGQAFMKQRDARSTTPTLQPKPERPTDTSKAYSTPAPSGGYGGTADASKPTTAFSPTSTADAAKSSAMDQFAKANPKLAAAAAERDRTRGTSATTNPLMAKTFGADYVSKMSAPKTPSPTTSSTAFSSSTPALGSSTPAMQSAGGASASKPVTNQTKTAFSNPSLLSQTTAAEKPEPKKAATPPSRMPLRNSHIITGYLVREGYISEKTDLPGDQEKIDANKNGKIDADDFKLLRAGKKAAKTAGNMAKSIMHSEPGNEGKMTKV
jgi:hypothetical protein